MDTADSKASALSQANAALMWRNGLANTATFELTAAQLNQVLNSARAEALAAAAAPRTGLRGWLSRLLRPAPAAPQADVVPFPAPQPEPRPAAEPEPGAAAASEDEMEALRVQIRAIYAEPAVPPPPPLALAPRAKARKSRPRPPQV